MTNHNTCLNDYFHMTNHYRKLKNARSKIDSSPPKGHENKCNPPRQTRCKPSSQALCNRSRNNIPPCDPRCAVHDFSERCANFYYRRSCSTPARFETKCDLMPGPCYTARPKSVEPMVTRVPFRSFAACSSNRPKPPPRKPKGTAAKGLGKKPDAKAEQLASQEASDCTPIYCTPVEQTCLPSITVCGSDSAVCTRFIEIQDVDLECECRKIACPAKKKVTLCSPICEEHEYLHFLLKITEDILRNDLYASQEMEKVFECHIQANLGRLDEGKMRKQIQNLRTELKLPVQSKVENVSKKPFCMCAPVNYDIVDIEAVEEDKHLIKEDQTFDNKDENHIVPQTVSSKHGKSPAEEKSGERLEFAPEPLEEDEAPDLISPNLEERRSQSSSIRQGFINGLEDIAEEKRSELSIHKTDTDTRTVGKKSVHSMKEEEAEMDEKRHELSSRQSMEADVETPKNESEFEPHKEDISVEPSAKQPVVKSDLDTTKETFISADPSGKSSLEIHVSIQNVETTPPEVSAQPSATETKAEEMKPRKSCTKEPCEIELDNLIEQESVRGSYTKESFEEDLEHIIKDHQLTPSREDMLLSPCYSYSCVQDSNAKELYACCREICELNKEERSKQRGTNNKGNRRCSDRDICVQSKKCENLKTIRTKNNTKESSNKKSLTNVNSKGELITPDKDHTKAKNSQKSHQHNTLNEDDVIFCDCHDITTNRTGHAGRKLDEDDDSFCDCCHDITTNRTGHAVRKQGGGSREQNRLSLKIIDNDIRTAEVYSNGRKLSMCRCSQIEIVDGVKTVKSQEHTLVPDKVGHDSHKLRPSSEADKRPSTEKGLSANKTSPGRISAERKDHMLVSDKVGHDSHKLRPSSEADKRPSTEEGMSARKTSLGRISAERRDHTLVSDKVGHDSQKLRPTSEADKRPSTEEGLSARKTSLGRISAEPRDDGSRTASYFSTDTTREETKKSHEHQVHSSEHVKDRRKPHENGSVLESSIYSIKEKVHDKKTVSHEHIVHSVDHVKGKTSEEGSIDKSRSYSSRDKIYEETTKEHEHLVPSGSHREGRTSADRSDHGSVGKRSYGSEEKFRSQDNIVSLGSHGKEDRTSADRSHHGSVGKRSYGSEEKFRSQENVVSLGSHGIEDRTSAHRSDHGSVGKRSYGSEEKFRSQENLVFLESHGIEGRTSADRSHHGSVGKRSYGSEEKFRSQDNIVSLGSHGIEDRTSAHRSDHGSVGKRSYGSEEKFRSQENVVSLGSHGIEERTSADRSDHASVGKRSYGSQKEGRTSEQRNILARSDEGLVGRSPSYGSKDRINDEMVKSHEYVAHSESYINKGSGRGSIDGRRSYKSEDRIHEETNKTTDAVISDHRKSEEVFVTSQSFDSKNGMQFGLDVSSLHTVRSNSQDLLIYETEDRTGQAQFKKELTDGRDHARRSSTASDKSVADRNQIRSQIYLSNCGSEEIRYKSTPSLCKTAIKIHIDQVRDEDYVLVENPICIPRFLVEKKAIPITIQDMSMYYEKPSEQLNTTSHHSTRSTHSKNKNNIDNKQSTTGSRATHASHANTVATSQVDSTYSRQLLPQKSTLSRHSSGAGSLSVQPDVKSTHSSLRGEPDYASTHSVHLDQVRTSSHQGSVGSSEFTERGIVRQGSFASNHSSAKVKLDSHHGTESPKRVLSRQGSIRSTQSERSGAKSTHSIATAGSRHSTLKGTASPHRDMPQNSQTHKETPSTDRSSIKSSRSTDRNQTHPTVPDRHDETSAQSNRPSSDHAKKSSKTIKPSRTHYSPKRCSLHKPGNKRHSSIMSNIDKVYIPICKRCASVQTSLEDSLASPFSATIPATSGLITQEDVRRTSASAGTGAVGSGKEKVIGAHFCHIETRIPQAHLTARQKNDDICKRLSYMEELLRVHSSRAFETESYFIAPLTVDTKSKDKIQETSAGTSKTRSRCQSAKCPVNKARALRTRAQSETFQKIVPAAAVLPVLPPPQTPVSPRPQTPVSPPPQTPVSPPPQTPASPLPQTPVSPLPQTPVPNVVPQVRRVSIEIPRKESSTVVRPSSKTRVKSKPMVGDNEIEAPVADVITTAAVTAEIYPENGYHLLYTDASTNVNSNEIRETIAAAETPFNTDTEMLLYEEEGDGEMVPNIDEYAIRTDESEAASDEDTDRKLDEVFEDEPSSLRGSLGRLSLDSQGNKRVSMNNTGEIRPSSSRAKDLSENEQVLAVIAPDENSGVEQHQPLREPNENSQSQSSMISYHSLVPEDTNSHLSGNVSESESEVGGRPLTTDHIDEYANPEPKTEEISSLKRALFQIPSNSSALNNPEVEHASINLENIAEVRLSDGNVSSTASNNILTRPSVESTIKAVTTNMKEFKTIDEDPLRKFHAGRDMALPTADEVFKTDGVESGSKLQKKTSADSDVHRTCCGLITPQKR